MAVKQKLEPVLKRYRVKGTFSYLEFCHTNDCDREDCPSFEKCEGHEVIKTIDVIEDEYTKDAAATSVILGYRGYCTDATWLIGYPEIKFIRYPEFTLPNYWIGKPIEQDAIRKWCGL